MKKFMVEDTQPSTMGRRVIPVIDASMKAKSEAAAKKRQGKVCTVITILTRSSQILDLKTDF